MRIIFGYLLILLCSFSAFSQTTKDLKFIFVPHPRSENKTQQSVLPGIEKIDFSLYDMTLLGGDLTYYTSISRTSMDYCDKLFDLKSPNTLWTMGNHDLNSRSLIQEYTGRPPYYAFYRDHITFLVLDTEQNASGLTKSLISGAQLDWLKTVTDTISNSDYLIVLHGRLLWMIGNDDLKTRLDSVAESTKQLVSTNFYPDVFPLLQKVKAKGVRVMCLGGDKSKINIDYSPEDSIYFLTSTMAPEFTDDQNDVMVFNYNIANREMSWKFVSLTNIEKKIPDAIIDPRTNPEPILKVWQSSDLRQINLLLKSDKNKEAMIRIFSVDGLLCQSLEIKPNESTSVSLKKSGMYIIEASVDKALIVRKVVVQ
jgi:hypothetical protein